MLTYPKSTMRVRCMSMHLSSGHVTLVPRKFYPTPNFPPIGLRVPGGLTFGLRAKYLVYLLCYYHEVVELLLNKACFCVHLTISTMQCVCIAPYKVKRMIFAVLED